MDYSILAIALLLLGLALLAAEVFLPSGGILSALVAICIIGSLWCGWSAWWETGRIYFWVYLGATLILVPAVLIGALAVFPQTSMGKKLLLDAPLLDDIMPHAAETRRLSQFIGKIGTAVTMHGPGGMVVVEGERMHSESEGMLIEPGTPVEVIRLNATRLVVRAVSPQKLKEAGHDVDRMAIAATDESAIPKNSADASISSPHADANSTATSEPNLVDFDIPLDET
ncbi:MAG: NfeD family protein [Planctomycetaceae bacterium]